MKVQSPIHEEFRSRYSRILDLFESYQQEVVRHSEYEVSCKPGCSHCCSHWVEDVYSFEGEIMADFVWTHFPERVHSLIEIFRADEDRLISLNRIVEEKMQTVLPAGARKDIDQVDVLLIGFHQLRLPCALLDKECRCTVYPVRPLTCRAYQSFSPPDDCRPEHIKKSDNPTYLLDMSEEAGALLDELHERYKRYDTTGLRALLRHYLSEDPPAPSHASSSSTSR